MEQNSKRTYFEKQYLRLYNKLYYCALAVICSKKEAEEAVREGVLTMYSRLDDNCSSREFDVRIFAALTEAAERLRQTGGFSRSEKVRGDDDTQLLAELGKISHKERLCTALNGIAGLSAADIAEITDIRASEVRTNISLGKGRLKKSGLKAMRRGMLIKGQEDMFPLPEKLRPENIGDMLDNGSMVMTSAAIEAGYKEVREIHRRRTIPRSVIAVAAVLAVGGTGLWLHSRNTDEKPRTENTAVVQEESKDTGFKGLRRGSYKSLHTFLSTDTNDRGSAETIPDGRYFFSKDPDSTVSFISLEMRSFYESLCLYDGSSDIIPLTEDRLEKDKRCERKTLNAVNEENGIAYIADRAEFNRCRLDSGKAVYDENDLMSGTYLVKQLANEHIRNDRKPFPFLLGATFDGDHIIAAYDFHLPEELNEKAIYHEYCGICIFDKNSGELLYEYEQPGILEDLIFGENGRLTLISEYSAGRNAARAEMYNSGDPAFLPKTYENGEGSLIAEDDIYIAAKSQSAVLTIMSSIDPSDDVGCTDIMALTAYPSSILECKDEVLLISVSDDRAQIIKIDISDGQEITAVNYAPEECMISLYDKPDSFSKENGIYYISDQYSAAAFDEELNFLGGYERTVYNEQTENDEDLWNIPKQRSALVGSTVYFADINEGSYIPEHDVRIVESADLSDIDSPKVTKYLDDPLSAPAADYFESNGMDFFLNDEQLFHLKEYYQDDSTYKITPQLISLRPEDTAEGALRYYSVDWSEEEERSLFEIIDEIPINKPGTLSEFDIGKMFILLGSDFCLHNGRYICLPLETEYDYDSKEITFEEYEKLYDSENSENLDLDYDEENGRERYLYYNSVTAKQSYILLDTDGGKLNKVCTTPPSERVFTDLSSQDIYETSSIGFVVKDGYIYIFNKDRSADVYPIA